MVTACRLCRDSAVEVLLDFGSQPICNRFLADPSASESLYPLILGQCQLCGLVQLAGQVPAEELLPPFDWITYTEPEDHLDELADVITGLPGLDEHPSVLGISFKDDSTLARLERRGFRTGRIQQDGDLGISERGAGVETVQARLTPERASAIARKYGQADVVVARHILEHAADMTTFMDAVDFLAKPDGHIVFEAPDCSAALAKKDYTTVWEEHFVYFTPETFRASFELRGDFIERFEVYPYPFESSLTAIVQRGRGPEHENRAGALQAELDRALDFAQAFLTQKEKTGDFLASFGRDRGKVALFGAGHLAAVFINFFELGQLIEFVVDDNPNKRGLFMPGSKLPIRTSSALVDEGIRLCLLSLSPQSEDKVIGGNRAFVGGGGRFNSIIPASRHALFPAEKGWAVDA